MDGDTPKLRARPRRPALLAGVAAVSGCCAVILLDPGMLAVPVGAVSTAILLLLALLMRRRLHLAPWLIAGAVACAMFAWGGWRSLPASDSLQVRFPTGADLVRIEGTIVEGADYVRRDPAAFEYPEAPEPQEGFPIGADPRRNVSYLLRAEALPDLGEVAGGFVKLYAAPGTDVRPGARVQVLGRLRMPRRAGNPGEVDSLSRYRLRGITHTMTLPRVDHLTIVQQAPALSLHNLAYSVHVAFHDLVGSRLPRDRAAVLGATLLGERGNLTHEQRARFVRSGTVHLLVVSGLHVGLLAGALVFFLRVMGMDPRRAWVAGAAAAVLYLIITGVQPSVTRATVMLVIYALGRVLVRRPDALNVLAASALVLLVIDPADVAELGFQLSYLSVIGIFVLSPALRLRRPPTASERAAEGWRRRALDWLGGSVRISLAVGLCTWPLLAATVHVFSPIMIFSNIAASPLLGLLLVLGLLTPLAIIPGVGAALAWLLSLLAGLLDGMAGTFASVPYGHLFVAEPPLWWLLPYYVLLAGVMLLPRIGLPRVSGAALWLLWLCALPASALVGGEGPGPAKLTALDVGQGQCVVLEVPGGPCVVLDCGSTSLGAAGERVLAPYLWHRRRSVIDVLLISHADADHVNGLPQLLERFRVGVVYVPETFEDDDAGKALAPWLRRHADVQVLARGDRIDVAPGLAIHCLWPDAAFVRGMISDREQRNEGGLVLELQAGPTRVLLPSDVETRGLAAVLPELGRADILFAPHQGSLVAGLPEILRALAPKHVVISARETFPAEESLQAYEDSGARVWKTWQHGAVAFELGADGGIKASAFIADD